MCVLVENTSAPQRADNSCQSALAALELYSIDVMKSYLKKLNTLKCCSVNPPFYLIIFFNLNLVLD